LTSIIREALDKPRNGGVTLADVIVDVAIKEAAKGDFRYFKEIIDRMDGKVPDRIELAEGETTETDEAAAAIAAAKQARDVK